MRWTRCVRLTSACHADGEVVWFWRPDAGAKSFAQTSLRERRRWQESPVTGKSTKETVTPSRRESRNAPVEPVVLPRAFCCTGPTGATSTRLSLHPQYSRRVESDAKLGRNSSRECKLTPSRYWKFESE